VIERGGTDVGAPSGRSDGDAVIDNPSPEVATDGDRSIESAIRPESAEARHA
jgi:hypothetical protein